MNEGSTDKTRVYLCKDCGHAYGERTPALPTIHLHRVVSHGGE